MRTKDSTELDNLYHMNSGKYNCISVNVANGKYATGQISEQYNVVVKLGYFKLILVFIKYKLNIVSN